MVHIPRPLAGPIVRVAGQQLLMAASLDIAPGPAPQVSRRVTLLRLCAAQNFSEGRLDGRHLRGGRVCVA